MISVTLRIKTKNHPPIGLSYFIFIALLANTLSITGQTNPSPSINSKKVVSVMDFENLSGNQKWNWIGKGLSEAVVYKLGRLDRFTIVERNKLDAIIEEIALSQAGFTTSDNVLEIGKMIQSDIMIFGAYQISGENIFVTARYVDVKTGEVLSTRKAVGLIENIFHIEEVIAFGLLLSLDIQIQGYDKALLSHKRTDSIQAIKNMTAAIEWNSKYLISKQKKDVQDYSTSEAFLDSAAKYALLAVVEDPLFAEAHNTLGVIFEAQGNFKAAISEYKTAIIGEDSTWHLPYFNMGNVFYELGDFNSSIVMFNKAVHFSPTFSKGYYSIGVVFDEIGKHENAKNYYRKALYHNPKYAKAFSNLGRILYEEGDLDSSIYYLRKAIDSDSGFVYGYYNLALVLEKLQLFTEAKFLLEKAITVEPSIEILRELANIYTELGENEKAFESYKEVIEYNKMDFKAWLGIANYYHRNLRDFSPALEAYDMAIQINPSLSPAYCGKAQILTQIGQIDNAIRELKKAIKIDPTWIEPYYLIAWNEYNKKNTKESLRFLNICLTMDTTYYNAHMLTGIIFIELGELELSQKSFNKATIAEPDSAEGWMFLGDVCSRLGEFNTAKLAFQNALRIDPKQKESKLAFAALELLDGDFIAAERRYRNLMKQYPSDYKIQFESGLGFATIGKNDEAIECFIRAMEIDSSDTQLYFFIGNQYYQTNNYQKAVVYLEKAFSHNQSKEIKKLLRKARKRAK